jgi:hypothetical protein
MSEKINKLINEYLTTSFGESPVFESYETRTIYDPYTFQAHRQKFYNINSMNICYIKIIDDNFNGFDGDSPIFFNKRLIQTIDSLFNAELIDINFILNRWFRKNIINEKNNICFS